MKATVPVTVIVPVKNEEANIAECLDRLARFDEVIVVDSGSRDRTCDIAVDKGARVIQFEWDGKYPKKRNWVLLNVELRNPWVMFLDADELVSEEFCEELLVAVSRTEYDGFWLNYTCLLYTSPSPRD